ncbi:hypothetical protein GETHLI_32220 [Geothrix limicola]|uniref:F5/8 type C domain-containing protein n=1 Tax=Geothrix limicola TaxID=2927978 RepID=A0ABQ5QKR9_9BACT|nr:endo-alpha-N-acetylgalactosaminidase family protein [Geothrix limicola]GLH74720.1 hypothetical protein GETHLI_32220 [Geothrix limicola]
MTPARVLFTLVALSGLLQAETLSSDKLSVALDPAFPGIQSYTSGRGKMILSAPGSRLALVNGKACEPLVTFRQEGPGKAKYSLRFETAQISCTLRVQVEGNTVLFRVTDIVEAGEEPLYTLALPGLVTMAARGGDEAAVARLPFHSYKTGKKEDDDEIGPVSSFKPEVRGASYAFVCSGGLAVGAYANTLIEKDRLQLKVEGQGAEATLSIAPGTWTWRAVRKETTWEPELRVVVVEDVNGDGRVTWQDAAVASRAILPTPYGAQTIPTHPLAHILMNFASQATTPFLRGLDQLKKVWLYTDGLGQRVQYKGFAGEGHDSSHPDYGGNVGRRQGGREELNLAMRRGHDFGVLSGVHINAQEYHKEAKHFRPDLVDEKAIGWSWLDESYLTNYHKDTASGAVESRLREMREDLPFLDFAYLDVYYGMGWPGWKMHTTTNGLGIMQHTEFPGTMERAVIWNHVANDWTQAIWGAGDQSVIARFVFNHQKDTFGHTPLLRGANSDGFLGWHAEHDMNVTIRSAFTVNLPTKYLQHFPLMSQTEAEARFATGVRSEVKDGVARLYSAEGHLLNSCTYPKPASRPEHNLCFIPWDPVRETKIYHWSDQGGESTWDLPVSWKGLKEARLYRLTDLGRTFERTVPIQEGRITLGGIAAATPYVLYREDPGSLPDMQWGEGSLVKDPGFDSHGFTSWTKTSGGEAVRIENDAFAQTHLVMAAPGEVRQVVKGLKPGQTYAASVWVEIESRRQATLSVRPSQPTLREPALDRRAWTLISQGRGQNGNDPEKLFDGDPNTFWKSQVNKKEPAKSAKFPHTLDVSLGDAHELEGFIQTARPGLPEGTIDAFEAFTSLDGKAWTKAAVGRFSYDASGRATVPFARKAKARFFRLVAKSALKGGDLATCAELDFLGHRLPAPQTALSPVSRSIDRTVLPNYTDQSQKYLRRYHRMKVIFQAPSSGEAVLALSAGEGQDAVRFDDVRLVATELSKPPAKAKSVVLFEDFEHVDEGWGPFMYAFEGPMQTHLSETHKPYTDDTLRGDFSLKTWNEDVDGLVYRTVPATLALKPRTKYRVSFSYLANSADRFSFQAGSEAAKEAGHTAKISKGTWKPATFTTTFSTGSQDDWFVGIAKTKGQGILVIDDLLIEEVH